MDMASADKEMLFVVGEFLRETGRRFAKSALKVSVSKAEFIDVIRSLKVVRKSERAIYRNLEKLEKMRHLVYDDRKLKISKKGYKEYERIRRELDHFQALSAMIKAKKITFKRKQQTKLK